MLGSGHGRLASAAPDTAAEVVAVGNRSSADERDGPGNTGPQHADPHV